METRRVYNGLQLVAGLTIRGLVGIELGIPLRHELTLCTLAVSVRSGTVVECGVQIDPNLGGRIALVLGKLGGLSEAERNQHSIEHRQVRIGSLVRSAGTCRRRRGGGPDRMIRPDTPTDDT